jgi:hypothetical protein
MFAVIAPSQFAKPEHQALADTFASLCNEQESDLFEYCLRSDSLFAQKP